MMFRVYIQDFLDLLEEKPGKWISLPCEEEFPTTLVAAGYESDISGLTERLYDFESINALNAFMKKLQNLKKEDYEKFCLIVGSSMELSTHGLEGLFDLADSLDRYETVFGFDSEQDLGLYLAGFYQTPEMVRPYLDYQRLGRDHLMATNGALYQGYFIERRTSYGNNE